MTPLPLPSIDLAALTSPWRDEFPVVTDLERIYLNAAGEGPLSRTGEAALMRYLEEKRFPHRKTITDAFTVPAAIREVGAALIGADPAGCAVVPSTNYGMNIVAQGFPWEAGDRVLCFAGEFPACVYPFLNLAHRGVTVDFCPLNEGIPDYSALPALMTPRTCLVVASWVQFFNGFTHDLGTLRAAADQVGALVVLDPSQGVGLAPLDCRGSGVDVCTFSGHKSLCAPVGSGLFYLDPKWRSRVAVSFCGWLAQMPHQDFGDLVNYQILQARDGRRFETGSDAQAILKPFRAMLEWFVETGVDRLAAHVQQCQAALCAGLIQRQCRLGVDPAHCINMSVFRAPEEPKTAALFQRLWDGGVVCSFREGWIRISPHVYTDGQDIARFFAVLDTALA